MPSDENSRQRLEREVGAVFTRLCQLYGIPPNLGRLYSTLYMSPEPLSLAELAAAAGLAKSSTSVAMRRLEQYRFVRRRPRGNDRKDYYEAVTDPLAMIQDWIRHFIRPELELSEELLRTLDEGLFAAERAEEYSADEAAELRLRVEQMRRAIHGSRALIEMLSAPDFNLAAAASERASADPE